MRAKHKVPPAVTAEVFGQWRSPVRGTKNPEKMNNPFWEWLVEIGIDAYHGNNYMNGPSSREAGPCWCFNRFGRTSTKLPDGRLVQIGGEHEDYYDADFYIYNDVVVTAPNGCIDIYGYTADVFPPTDFHSATLIDDAILLIGSLSYPANRLGGQTQVMRLDLETFCISNVETFGDNPGWIHRHTSTLVEGDRAIVVSGGKVDLREGTSLVENIDDWHLDLGTWCWKRLTKKKWSRFEVHRKDGKSNHLWHLQQLQWSKETGWDDAEKKTKELSEKLGKPPRPDVIPSLYIPGIADEVLPEVEGEHRVHRIRIGDVVVRYVENSFSIQVTVEGELSEDAIQVVRSDLVEKLSLLEQASVHFRDIPPL